MRICIVSREYPPESGWGGIGLSYQDVALGLASKGHEVHVICQAVRCAGTSFDRGVWVHRVGHLSARFSLVARLDYSICAFFKLVELNRKLKLGLVDVPTFAGEPVLPMMAGVRPVIVSVHGLHEESLRARNFKGFPGQLALRILSRLEGPILRRADMVVVLTRGTRRRLVTTYNISESRVRVLPTAVDPEYYQDTTDHADMREQLGGGHVAVSVGRLEPNKGYEFFLRAIPKVLRSIPHFTALLVGADTKTGPDSTSYKGLLENLATILGIVPHVRFLGKVTPKEVVELLSVGDILVVPSINDEFPRVVLEAMACERPVVTTALDYVSELPSESDVYTVKSGDYDALAEQIVYAIKETGGVSKKNREIVMSSFSSEIRTERLYELYEQALSHSMRERGPRSATGFPAT